MENKKRYFINGEEITEQEAKKQEERNQEILSLSSNEDFLKYANELRFIVII